MCNDVGIMVLTKVHKMQNMRQILFASIEGVEDVMTGIFEAIPAHGEFVAVEQSFKISKNFLAYLEMLVYVAPYWRQDDPKITPKLDRQYKIIKKRYSRVDYPLLHHNLTKWMKAYLTKFPPPASVLAAAGRAGATGADPDADEGSEDGVGIEPGSPVDDSDSSSD